MKVVLVNAATHASVHGLYRKGIAYEVSPEAGKFLLASKNEFDVLYFLTEAEAIKKGEKVLQHENGSVVYAPKSAIVAQEETPAVKEPVIKHQNGGTDPDAPAPEPVAEVTTAANTGDGEIDTGIAPAKPAKAKGKAVEI